MPPKLKYMYQKSAKVYVMNHFEYRENKRTDENMSESPTSSIRIFAEQIIDYIRLSDMDKILMMF